MNYVSLYPGDVVQAVQIGGERPADIDDVSIVETEADPLPGQVHKGGDVFEDAEPDEMPPPRLPDVSDRQFAAGLWGDGVITFEECRAFVKIGDIPAALQAILDMLPDDNTGEPTPRKEAEVLLSGATNFVFSHPLVDVVRQAQGWTVEHLRARWAVWATL